MISIPNYHNTTTILFFLQYYILMRLNDDFVFLRLPNDTHTYEDYVELRPAVMENWRLPLTSDL